MDTWTLQMGYPVVTASLSSDGTKVPWQLCLGWKRGNEEQMEGRKVGRKERRKEGRMVGRKVGRKVERKKDRKKKRMKKRK